MRLSPLTFVLAAAISNVPLISHAADKVPDFDISANCRAGLPGPGGTGETLNRCADDERQARQKLFGEWSRFDPADKITCIRETNIDAPSYVELLTCLQMASDNRPR
jgi:hypothetical protein